ncbi:hypothetical protein P691DRAFT_779668 [Macrolepiota fuliginosa MF-IS2]|uniref:NACHT domain-containing protein n=1 Tax=Macrolepiota fuliginosa MF-IS2 TaxID=1400762 RepID=A0A9P6BXT6_9AGAR|nr:hypothetical protein P691DRAFT_779668 [Macrolepiota fuliginosa MF-IS2]
MSGLSRRLNAFLSARNPKHSEHEDNAVHAPRLVTAQNPGASQGSHLPRQGPPNSDHIYSRVFASSNQPNRNEQNNPGMFYYASGFSITNSVISEHIQLIDPSSALQLLEGRAMPDVEYNSGARDPPPRCYDGTRSEFVTMAEISLSGAGVRRGLLLMHGPAGVGKSALIQTLAERQARKKPLLKVVTLFFPPSSPSPGDASRIWPTISYQLAISHPPYLDYVIAQIKRDPRLMKANMEQQFQMLIAKPLGEEKLLTSSSLVPIFIDGLDKCQQYETILQLIGKLIFDYPDMPLFWIITTRTDMHLLKAAKRFTPALLRFIPVDSDDAVADVKHFLRSKFSDLQDRYDITDPSPWPREHDFGHVQVSASGYFMIASAIAQFVGDREAADPQSQLETILALPSEPSTPGVSSPFFAVHRLYMEILITVSDAHYRTARRIIGFYLLPRGFGAYNSQSTSFWALCNILGIKENVAYACLFKLRSLLDIPDPGSAFDTPIRFFHTSFADFLADRDASDKFWIDIKEVVDDLWQCHSRILWQANLPDTPLPQPGEVKVAWPSSLEETQETRIRIWRNAQRVFLHQLLPCPTTHCAMGVHYHELSSKGSTKRMKVIQEINFHNIVDCYTLPDVPYRLLAFLDWIIEGGGDLICHNLWEKLDPKVQGFNWLKEDGISFRIDVERSPEGGSLIMLKAYTDLVLTTPAGVPVEGLFSTRDPPGTKSQLLNDLTFNKDNFSTSIVVGSKVAGRCALLVDRSAKDMTVYYVLPYIRTTNQQVQLQE